jgi:formamidase
MKTRSLTTLARALSFTLIASATLVAGAGASAAERGGPIVIPKTGARCVDDPHCHNRWHPAIPRAATAKPGDVVVFSTATPSTLAGPQLTPADVGVN